MTATSLRRSAIADRRVAALSAGLVVLMVDQITKAAAVSVLGNDSRSWGPFRVHVVRNFGGPFGVAQGTSMWWTLASLIIVVAAVAMIVGGRTPPVATVLIGAMIGGGLSNMADRVLVAPGAGRGPVIDWIEVAPYPRVFNLADVALRVGALLAVVALLRGNTRGSAPIVD